jgi:hypothetical protein
MDDDVEFEFIGPGECELCQSLVGTVSSVPLGQIHPNCGCLYTPRCNNTCSFVGGSTVTRNATGEYCIIFNATITVKCWDGTERGETVPIDIGCGVGMYDQTDAIEAGMAAEVIALMDSCPDCTPPAVA